MGRTEDDVVDKADAEELARLDQAFGCLDVLLARLGIAGRMVVRDNNCKSR